MPASRPVSTAEEGRGEGKRRTSGRLRGIVESEEDEDTFVKRRNVPRSARNDERENREDGVNSHKERGEESELDEDDSRYRRAVGTRHSDDEYEEAPADDNSAASSSDEQSDVSSPHQTASASEDEIVTAQRHKRLRNETQRADRSSRAHVRVRRKSESERLICALEQSEAGRRTGRSKSKSKMEEEDAALAAAIAAGYYSDDEREASSRRRGMTRHQPRNPYERSTESYAQPPMRRSGRMAAMVSAARVALYSSLFNPDGGHAESARPPLPYNLRSSRAPLRPVAPSDHGRNLLGFLSDEGEGELAVHSGRQHRPNLLERLFEDGDGEDNDGDDDDGDLNQRVNPHSHPHEGQSGTAAPTASPVVASGTLSLAGLDEIAGMEGYVRRLKEMVVFPLVYPQLFARLNIALPRGVLFHGPPGTGKTLMARLLAAACSTSTRKVSFFMRNGSDCLSKWIGEAERNMRLLFKKARECQPAIIFFDEIDGLAPERTGRQDQSHVSLVSTLLALLDGLDDRGQVIVIGATNRIDAIDAALRRPGRFDREFYFGLPDETARRQMLAIHTRAWIPTVDAGLMADLAGRTAGFSGADMKALCAEAALRAVQRTFPAAYETIDETGAMDAAQVSVAAGDFERALLYMAPSARRHASLRDLAAHQKPQQLLYADQQTQLMDTLVRPVLRCQLAGDGGRAAVHQLAEPLLVRIVYDAATHPEAFVWRFMCGLADRLDGFAVLSADLVSDALGDAGGDAMAHLWRVLADLRSKGPATLLVKSIDALGRAGRREMMRMLRMFARTLVPGEPVTVFFMTRRMDRAVRDGGEMAASSKTTPIKTFYLDAPGREQTLKYFSCVLRSIYRVLAASHVHVLVCNEDAFVDLVLGGERGDTLMRSTGTVFACEQRRMQWTDLALKDPVALFCEVTGRGDLLAVKEGAVEEGEMEGKGEMEDVVTGTAAETVAETAVSTSTLVSPLLPEDILFDSFIQDAAE